MANIAELKEFLNEHVRYELVQIRHCLNRLREIEGGKWSSEPQQLDWNAFIESFGTHARNLAAFLTNESADTDRKAREYNKSFKHSAKELDNFKWGAFVFHLGKTRLARTAAGTKPTLAEAEAIAKWVEDNFAAFLSGMDDEPFKSTWDERAARPEFIRTGLVLNATQPTTSSAPTMISLSIGKRS